MKNLIVGLLVVAGIVLALLVFLRLQVDPEDLGARLIEQIDQQSGIRVVASNFLLHPLRGLELTDATATGRLESGEIRAEVKLLRVQHRILPLLRGEFVIEDILFLEPAIELLARSAEDVRRQEATDRVERRRARRAGKRQKEAPKKAASVEGGDRGEPLRLSIRSLVIENGSLSIRPPERAEASFQLEGLNLRLEGLTFDPAAAASSEAMTGAGRVSTGRIVHGDLEASEARGQIRIARGIAEVTELNVHSANAYLMIDRLTIQLLQEPPSYTVEVAGSLDLNGGLGFEARHGFGPVTMNLEAEGEGPELEAMVGKGTLTLGAGAIPGIPSVLQIEELLGQPLLTGRQYATTEIDYRVTANRLVLEPFEMAGDGATIGGSGEIDLAGPLALDIFVRLPRRGLEEGELTEEQLASLVGEGGMVTIPFTVGGTIDDPSVTLTWDGTKALAAAATKSWAEEALDEAKKRATEWLKSRTDDQNDG